MGQKNPSVAELKPFRRPASTAVKARETPSEPKVRSDTGHDTPFRAVIFDLDGTLFDSLADLGNCMNEVLRLQGFPGHPLDAYRYFVGDGMRKLVIRALPSAAGRDPKIVDSCATLMYEVYGGNWAVHSRLYEGVPEMLDRLVELQLDLCILSNKPTDLTTAIREEFLSPWNFALTYGASKDFPLKPDPAGALAIARQLGHPAPSFLYLGDTGIDMHTANAAGMYPIGCLWGFREERELRDAGARLLLSHPRELGEWLAHNNRGIEPGQ